MPLLKESVRQMVIPFLPSFSQVTRSKSIDARTLVSKTVNFDRSFSDILF